MLICQPHGLGCLEVKAGAALPQPLNMFNFCGDYGLRVLKIWRLDGRGGGDQKKGEIPVARPWL